MEGELNGRRVAVLATDGVEQSELTDPWEALKGAGAQVWLVAPEKTTIRAEKHHQPADSYDADLGLMTAHAHEFEALVLPGGKANGDALRRDQRAIEFAQAFFRDGKPVGAVCHGGWLLANAGLVKGRTMTSATDLADEFRNAGAEWVDEGVVVDAGFVTSRKPEDLPAFCRKLIEEIAEGPHQRQAEMSAGTEVGG